MPAETSPETVSSAAAGVGVRGQDEVVQVEGSAVDLGDDQLGHGAAAAVQPVAVDNVVANTVVVAEGYGAADSLHTEAGFFVNGTTAGDGTAGEGDDGCLGAGSKAQGQQQHAGDLLDESEHQESFLLFYV